MSDERNPFTPSFGVSPPVLAGREEAIDVFVHGLEEGVGSPHRAILLGGQRGSGKTVLLNALEDEAHRRGWAVVSETTRPGVADTIARSALPLLLRELDPDPADSVVTGVDISVAGSGAGVTRERVERFPVEPTLRTRLTELADLLDLEGRGVLITLDELSREGGDDLRDITQAVQHAFREGRAVAFVAAGLPAQVSALLDGPSTTFLRRAERLDLGPMSAADATRALVEPIRRVGRQITDEAAELASTATKGYPFMVQLVGYHLWAAAAGEESITTAHARTAVERAARRIGQLVHEPTLRALSRVDRAFLRAMAQDDGPSRISDVAERLGVDRRYAGMYRARLIAAEVVHPVGHGLIDLSLPSMRELLREQEDA